MASEIAHDDISVSSWLMRRDLVLLLRALSMKQAEQAGSLERAEHVKREDRTGSEVEILSGGPT